MGQVGKRQFLQHASRYLNQTEKTGHELVITHHNKPRLKIVPVTQKTIRDLRGTLKKCKIKGDMNAPVFPEIDKWFS